MTRELVLVANARMPSQRAQSLQVAQVAASFERAGHPTTLLHARRRDTPVINAEALWDHYSVPEGPRPQVRALACTDWIDRFPRHWQYLPARVQELTFSMSAAREVSRKHADALVLSRELEAANTMVRKGLKRVFLEVHRVPGGNLRRKWLREAGPKLAGVIAISGGVRGDLIELGVPAGQILVAHDGFEPSRFADLPDQRAARAQLGLDPDRPLVVYTGGLLAWKGVELLVESARALPEVQVVVAGGMAADVARIERLGAGLGNLRIDGFQPPDRIATYLAAADIGVVPNRSTPAISARYTSPLKVFEAMAVGLPLVVSDLPSMREILSHDVDAWLVPPDSAAELTRGIKALLDDPERRARLGSALRAHSANYDWDARARRVLDWMLAR